jgi:hypothetical protein
MKALSRRAAGFSAAAAVTVGALAASVPASSALSIDPSAYAVSASGARANIAPTPAVDWTGGAGVQGSSGALSADGLSAGSAHVAAGDGYAEAVQHDLRYGAIEIRSITATCRGGHTAVQIEGTFGHRALTAAGLAAGGLSVRIGAVTHESDGSTSIAGATITGRGEQVTVAVARCGAAS